jgi:Tfp pilus assembly protein PilX
VADASIPISEVDRGEVRASRQIQTKRNEEGIALLISIFILLLISVVAIALIISSGTESSLAGNYRSATGVYYAALAGLEEARGRLLSNNANSFKNTAPGFLPPTGTPLAVCSPVYVINPVGGENVTPWDPANPYYDAQFNQEFAGICPAPLPPNPSPSTPSIWNGSPLNGLPFPGPLYKWVRINGVSEQSLKNLDTFPYDGTIESTPIYYGGTHITDVPNSNAQVLEITALAALPNGSQKLLQYLVAPQPLNLSFPAALILDGNTPQFTASPSANFYVKGIDQGSAGTCNPGSTPFIAVGYTDTSYTKSNFEQPGNSQGIPAGMLNNYTHTVGPNPSNPDIVPVTLSSNLLTVGGLNSLVQSIQQNADVVVNRNATQADMPAAMSPTNPMTIVINGDLTFSSWRSTGYGLLLVTGEFIYDPDASWDGIILVIGKGWMNSHQSAYTTTQIQGAVFLARTLDASGNPLPQSSPPIFTPVSSTSPSGFDFYGTPNTLTNGIYYSSCWIQAAMPAMSYKILSFHEISQ